MARESHARRRGGTDADGTQGGVHSRAGARRLLPARRRGEAPGVRDGAHRRGAGLEGRRRRVLHVRGRRG